MRVRVHLDTLRDVNTFVHICSQVKEPVYLVDGAHLKVSAKSIFGVAYSLEFEEIWCECERDIYSEIEQFVA